jgi:hypothetical protein
MEYKKHGLLFAQCLFAMRHALCFLGIVYTSHISKFRNPQFAIRNSKLSRRAPCTLHLVPFINPQFLRLTVSPRHRVVPLCPLPTASCLPLPQ